MLTKKFLSLSLAVGLAVGSSSSVFAVNGQYEFNGSTVNIAKNDAEIVKEFHNMLAIPAAIQIFVADAYYTVASALASSTAKAIYEFCNTFIKYNELAKFNNFEDSPCMDDICLDTLKMELCVKFENLYKNIPAFQKAFDDAWRVGAKKDRQKYASAPVRSTPRGSKTGFGPSDPRGSKTGFGPSDPRGSKCGFEPSDPRGSKTGFGPSDPRGSKTGFGPSDPRGSKTGFGPSDLSCINKCSSKIH